MPVSLKRLKYPERFEYESHDDVEIVMRRRFTTWQKHSAWLRKHEWPARVVIVLAEFALAYMYVVFVILLGAGFRG